MSPRPACGDEGHDALSSGGETPGGLHGGYGAGVSAGLRSTTSAAWSERACPGSRTARARPLPRRRAPPKAAGVERDRLGDLLGHKAGSVASKHYGGTLEASGALLVAKRPLPERVQLRGTAIEVKGGGTVAHLRPTGTGQRTSGR